MEVNKMQFERQLTEIGGSIMLVIPADLAKFLELKPRDTVIINEDHGKHGDFISFWKKKEEAKKE